MPQYMPGCATGGCVDWSSVNGAGALFKDGSVPKEAGASCAMPAATAGAHECDCGEKDMMKYINDSYAGPWCFCSDGSQAYCSPPNSVVEQLNLQLAASDVVVASFITYENLPAKPAIAMFGTSESNMQEVEGVSHKYTPPGRSYIMHFVPFRNLTDRQQYYYKVKSGSDASDWTPVYSFRAPYGSGVTRIATYGDMGHSLHNNMENLKEDCDSGLIDAIVHMGDHCYNMGFSGDARGDSYMNVFQPVLQSCPWMPIIGNHEASDGDHYKRYEQIAMGEMIGETEGTGISSTADSALGQHLSLGRLYGSGSHGTVPSNTSRYTSTNIGMIHIAGIDLMTFDDAQIAWLEKDLQAANSNREQVPWIMVAAHYQLYYVGLFEHWNASASIFYGEKAEMYKGEARFETCPATKEDTCQTLGEWHVEVTSKLEPLLLKYGVDVVNAGHIHNYEASWPMKYGSVCQKDYNNPNCPVYIVEGNGGVPGAPGSCVLDDCSDTDWCRVHGSECGAYGRITVTDAQTLQYDHVVNSNGEITDTFTIKQGNHGPFTESLV